ncbi:MAG: hypothetical protein ABIK92_00960 [Pseudomonadota bacterium]
MAKYNPDIHLNEYKIMPNHFHGIVENTPIMDIVETDAHVGADSISAPISAQISAHLFTEISIQNGVGVDYTRREWIGEIYRAEMDSAANRAEMDSAPTVGAGLSRVVQSFKRHTTIEYINMVKQNILPSFDKRIWQRNYWEHIIRNENEFVKISEYIRNNPMNWNKDKLNVGEGNFVMESSTPYNEENWMV